MKAREVAANKLSLKGGFVAFSLYFLIVGGFFGGLILTTLGIQWLHDRRCPGNFFFSTSNLPRQIEHLVGTVTVVDWVLISAISIFIAYLLMNNGRDLFRKRPPEIFNQSDFSTANMASYFQSRKWMGSSILFIPFIGCILVLFGMVFLQIPETCLTPDAIWYQSTPFSPLKKAAWSDVRDLDSQCWYPPKGPEMEDLVLILRDGARVRAGESEVRDPFGTIDFRIAHALHGLPLAFSSSDGCKGRDMQGLILSSR